MQNLEGLKYTFTGKYSPAFQYPLVAMLTTFLQPVGTTAAAMGVGYIFTHQSMVHSTNDGSWRIAFLIGAMVALVGTVARTSLKEASEFADKKASKERIEKQRDFPRQRRLRRKGSNVDYGGLFLYS